MAHIDRYMYVGEKAIFSMTRGSIFGSEELAATDRRVLHIKGEKFYDLKYESLVSLGCYTVYEWKWALAALVSIVTALLMSVTIFIDPEVQQRQHRGLDQYDELLGGHIARFRLFHDPGVYHHHQARHRHEDTIRDKILQL